MASISSLGLHIERIYKYRGTNKAFVVFDSVSEIELALHMHNTVTFNRLRFRAFRSSLEQLDDYLEKEFESNS